MTTDAEAAPSFRQVLGIVRRVQRNEVTTKPQRDAPAGQWRDTRYQQRAAYAQKRNGYTPEQWFARLEYRELRAKKRAIMPTRGRPRKEE